MVLCGHQKTCMEVARKPGQVTVRPHLHEQIKPPLIAQILDPYEVTLDKFAQIKYVLFAHVYAAFLVDIIID